MRPILVLTALALGIVLYHWYKNPSHPGTAQSVGTVQINMPKTTTQKSDAITGTVSIAKNLESHVYANSTLFIIVKINEQALPTAIKPIVQPKFPVTYTIGPEDVMMPGAALGQNMSVSALLSRTGNTMVSPGDLEGKSSKHASPGDENINVTIDSIR